MVARFLQPGASAATATSTSTRRRTRIAALARGRQLGVGRRYRRARQRHRRARRPWPGQSPGPCQPAGILDNADRNDYLGYLQGACDRPDDLLQRHKLRAGDGNAPFGSGQSRQDLRGPPRWRWQQSVQRHAHRRRNERARQWWRNPRCTAAIRRFAMVGHRVDGTSSRRRVVQCAHVVPAGAACVSCAMLRAGLATARTWGSAASC